MPEVPISDLAFPPGPMSRLWKFRVQRWEKTGFEQASKLDAAVDWDLLTTLMWITIRNLDDVGYIRAYWLESSERVPGSQESYFKRLDGLFHDVQVHHGKKLNIIELCPKEALKSALVLGTIKASGKYIAEKKRELISSSEWPSWEFCGGKWGDRIGGAGVPNEKDGTVHTATVEALSFKRQDVMAVFRSANEVELAAGAALSIPVSHDNPS